MRWEINSQALTPEIIRTFKMQAVAAGMSHGEWLAELVEQREGGKA